MFNLVSILYLIKQIKGILYVMGKKKQKQKHSIHFKCFEKEELLNSLDFFTLKKDKKAA